METFAELAASSGWERVYLDRCKEVGAVQAFTETLRAHFGLPEDQKVKHAAEEGERIMRITREMSAG